MGRIAYRQCIAPRSRRRDGHRGVASLLRFRVPWASWTATIATRCCLRASNVPTFLLPILLLSVAGAGILFPAAARGQGVACAVSPTELTIDAEEQDALEGMNALRATAGATALTLSASLGQAAAWKSGSMAATGLFAHNDPARAWTQRVQDCGYRASQIVGENLAWGTETGRATIQIWRDSPAHNQMMMNPMMRVVGIARVRSAGGWYWTADFGAVADGATPAAAPPPAVSAPPAPTSPPPAPARAALQAGGGATVNAGRGDCLNVHSAPGRSAPVTGCLADGVSVKVIAGPVVADGMTWWQIDSLGWVAADFLT